MEAPSPPCQVLTIGIDARFADTGTGLGRYTRELVIHIIKQKPEGVRFVLFVRDKNAPWLGHLSGENVHLSSLISHHYSFSEQFLFPILLIKNKIDLLWSPHFNVPLLCPVPFVVTIHDLILHRFPNQASKLKQLAYRFLMRRAVHGSRFIIAVSNFTASEITAFYGKKFEKKIHVVSEGVPDVFHSYSLEEAAPVLEKYGLTKPFFLYVGSAKEHKNIQLLFDAYAALQGTDASLVLVSGGKEFERYTYPSRTRLLEDVPDEDLAKLYALATAFVSPSLYEGFGLPIAESAACGCPVIAVAGSAVSEVAPKTARLIEPSLAALTEALEHPPARSGAVSQRSWEQVARDTLHVLLSSRS